jgi:hypothetical protein
MHHKHHMGAAVTAVRYVTDLLVLDALDALVCQRGECSSECLDDGRLAATRWADDHRAVPHNHGFVEVQALENERIHRLQVIDSCNESCNKEERNTDSHTHLQSKRCCSVVQRGGQRSVVDLRRANGREQVRKNADEQRDVVRHELRQVGVLTSTRMRERPPHIQ